MKQKQDKLREAWKERFDRRFGRGVFIHTKNDITLNKVQLFDFISKALQAERERVVKEVGEKICIDIWCDGCLQDLDRVLQSLKEEK